METENKNQGDKHLYEAINRLIGLIVFLLFCILGLLYVILFGFPKLSMETPAPDPSSSSSKSTLSLSPFGVSPDTNSIPAGEAGKQIRYGRLLIANTAFYLGPKGSVAHQSNGMNCQNCHLDAGTKPWGNNYSAVASTYPKFRERSGKTESIYKRVNDCFERSLNGKGLDSGSAEMQAIKAYIVWLGKEVKKGEKPAGSGIEDLAFLTRAADPVKGKDLFHAKCISCHGEDGQGKPNADGITYIYPPLWGEHSFNAGAGLFRIGRFAGYIKNNMPQGATKEAPQLTDEEAWDIAAFVNSRDRPKGDISKDWPNKAGKPVDHPFGPYADTFSEAQHKYGPYGPIAEARKKQLKKQSKKS